MNRHILLATDGSSFAKKALDYVATVFENCKDLEITVFCLAPSAPSYLSTPNPAIDEITRLERLEKIEAENLRWAQRVVEEAIEFLKEAGFAEGKLHPKVQLKRGDLAHAILREARFGKYDAVAVGRRGFGRLASAWMGSVSHKLVEYAQGVPVWVIDGREWNKRFLVAVDLGEPGLKVIDHVSFILSGHPEAEIVLFHVIPSLSGLWSRAKEEDLAQLEELLIEHKEKEALEFFRKAEKIFGEEAFRSGQIRIKIKASAFGPAGSIIKEAREGHYGTVVVGRRGLGGFKELLLGSVSSKVVFSLNEQAIWVVG